MQASSLSCLLLVLRFLAVVTHAVPASPLQDLSGDQVVPFLDNESALSDFNFTNPGTTSGDEVGVSKRAISLQYVLYSITMDGRGQNNFQNFVVSGSMIVTTGVASPGTTNGGNPVEVIISIGAPGTNPIAGSIRYCTNRVLYRLIGGSNANSLLDFARVGLQGSTVSVNVDPSLAAANQLSQFNARTGITANVFLIASGGFSFTVASGGTISGRAVLSGRGYIFPGTAPYTAIISGRVVGQGTLTV